MMEEIRELGRGSQGAGLAVVIWSYPRGGDLTKDGETAVDVCAYAAHMAACSAPTSSRSSRRPRISSQDAAKKVYESRRSTSRPWPTASATSCSAASTAAASSSSRAARRRTTTASTRTIRAIRDGGGNGSIIGRNTFQRPREEALEMLDKIIDIYQGKA